MSIQLDGPLEMRIIRQAWEAFDILRLRDWGFVLRHCDLTNVVS